MTDNKKQISPNRKPMKNVPVVRTHAVHDGYIQRYVTGKIKPPKPVSIRPTKTPGK